MRQQQLLLVTQYPDERVIYGAALRAEGFDVRIANGPDDAFLSAVRQRPDVVVTRVPQAGGGHPESDLLRRLKQGTQTQSVPVLVITSLIQPEMRATAVGAGCDAYILIPALPDMLVREVRRVLLGRSRRSAPHTAA
jgi:two-component system cell cycle response regulator DivK